MEDKKKIIYVPSLYVVIPTYNERETLPILLEQIHALAIPNLTVLVVDDNSPDGTGLLADTLTSEYTMHVIHRKEKKGLGLAYVHAFSEILSLPRDKQPDFIVQMDADLSHDPKLIPAFLKKISSYDLVLGSRYVSGGTISNWGIFRRLVSRLGNIYVNIILGVPYKDMTSGYKCYRRNVLRDIDVITLSSIGYNFQIESTFRVHKQGKRIAEIPITFNERRAGKSKFSTSIFLEAFLRVFLLRFKK